jgi:hypothetical protein
MISQPAVVLGVVRNEDGAVISDATVSIWKAGEAQSGFLDPPSEMQSDAGVAKFP